ncbi:MAG: hypothetical protein NTX82_00295 [Candidatus Parcubacteria bacterium]|nr:hypothetical protein [Candidatus Parcubacteria bacterium]
MTKNRKNGVTLLVVGTILIITAGNMYYNFDFFMNLIDPGNSVDLLARTIIKYMAIGDAFISLVLFGFGIYYIKKDDVIK